MLIQTVSIPSTCDETQQRIQYYQAPGKSCPLVVALHTWSYDYTQDVSARYFQQCAERGWHCIFPDFRGPNCVPLACGSRESLNDLQDAVNWAADTLHIDHRRIFLVGESGGGYMALLAAGKLPTLWTAVSAWASIVDLARWHEECIRRALPYAAELESVCGGAPGNTPETDQEYLARSPFSSLWRAHIVPIDINAGIHDGHGGNLGGAGSVPVGHSIRAFNELARASGKKRSIIDEDVIRSIEREERLPDGFANQPVIDPSYGREIHLRRVCSLARLTLFEGGHEILYDAAFRWFEGF